MSSKYTTMGIDMQDIQFGHCGEFSPNSDIVFEKHIKRLSRVAHFFNKHSRIFNITKTERFWYPVNVR